MDERVVVEVIFHDFVDGYNRRAAEQALKKLRAGNRVFLRGFTGGGKRFAGTPVPYGKILKSADKVKKRLFASLQQHEHERMMFVAREHRDWPLFGDVLEMELVLLQPDSIP